MARHDPHDHARRRRTTAERDDDGLPGYRPHGRLAPYRAPRGCDDPQALPDVRTPPAGPRGRCDGHDRRPLGQVPGAQPARRSHPAAQPGGHQGPAGETPRLRFRRPERRTPGQQLRLDEGIHVPGFHPRHRQVHHRQLHDGQGFGQEALQRRGSPPARSLSAASWVPRPRPSPSPARSSPRPTARSSARPRAATSGSTRATRRPTSSTSSGSTSATRMPNAISRSSRCSTARPSNLSLPSTTPPRTCACCRNGWLRRSPR